MHLIIIDASSWVFRDHFGRAATTNGHDGTANHAVSGFCDRLWKLRTTVETMQASHVAMVFDSPGKNFRHDIFPAYKSNRPEKPKEVIESLAAAREAVDAFGVTRIEAPGYEADDIIATLARLSTSAEGTVDIWSPDKDLCQLVRPGVSVITNKRTTNGQTRVTYDEATVEKEFGVPPKAIPVYLALVGDTSDGIPGIDKIGPKKAVAMIRQAMETTVFPIAEEHRADYETYLKLTTLNDSVPGITLEPVAVRPMERHLVAALLNRIDHPVLLRQIRRETR